MGMIPAAVAVAAAVKVVAVGGNALEEVAEAKDAEMAAEKAAMAEVEAAVAVAGTSSVERETVTVGSFLPKLAVPSFFFLQQQQQQDETQNCQ